MLENIVYEIIDLPYPKLDTQDLPNKLFKLNSTEQLIYLGEFQPYLIDDVVKNIESRRKDILQEIRKNSYDLGLEYEDKEELHDAINSITTFKDFKKEFNANLHKWMSQGLTLLYLPPYSPQLNIIEILWRFMKYVWIDHKAHLSFNNLKEYIENIFEKYGEDFIINFNSWKDDIYDKKLLPYYNTN